ncbi:hypothetical protein HRbin12_01715 [bacterium HR12]|nr:hypothetical protein HRbin12_01715 [bacterium HR12]
MEDPWTSWHAVHASGFVAPPPCSAVREFHSDSVNLSWGVPLPSLFRPVSVTSRMVYGTQVPAWMGWVVVGLTWQRTQNCVIVPRFMFGSCQVMRNFWPTFAGSTILLVPGPSVLSARCALWQETHSTRRPAGWSASEIGWKRRTPFVSAT